MKRIFVIAVLMAAASAPARAADVGVSVSVGQPGFYGRIDIGDYPPPQVIYQQPRIIRRVEVDRPPVYLHVPPGHARNWRRHCGAYNACDEQVYFVRNSWYEREYVPRYRERDRGRHDGYRGDHRGDGDNDRRGYDRDRDRNR